MLEITYAVPAAEFDIADFPTGASSFPVTAETVEVKITVNEMGANFVIDADRNEFDLGEVIENDHFIRLERVAGD